MNNKRSSVILAAAYIAAQGSVFGLNVIVAWQLGSAALGPVVLAVGLISFAYQFADFGNQNVLAKAIAANEEGAYWGMIWSRMLFSVLVTGVFSIYAAKTIPTGVLDPQYFILLPLLACIQAAQCGALHERLGNYRRFVVPQLVFWIGLCFVVALAAFSERMNLVPWFVVLVSMVATFFVYSQEDWQCLKRNRPTIKRFWAMSSVMIGPVMAQMWGRSLVIYSSATVSIATVGALGFTKNLQVALSLALGFYCRPLFVKAIARTSKSTANSSIPSIRELFPAFGLSLLGPTIVFVIQFLDFQSVAEYRAASVVLLVIPFWFGALVASQLIGTLQQRRYSLLSDSLGLSVNVAAFLIAKEHGVLTAIAVGEISQALIVCTIATFIHLGRK